MKTTIAATLILLSFAIQSFSQVKNFIDQPYIETSARVDTLVVPDRIYMNILVTEKDTKGKISVEELESKMETTLKNIGIDTKTKLTLNDLGSNFKKYFLKQQDVLKTKSYTLLVEEAITAGKVIVAMENINISNINIEKTEYSEIESLKLSLKSKAIVKAKEQAHALTEPLNQKVGSAIFISDQQNFYKRQAGNANIEIRGTSSMNMEFKPADIQFEKIRVESIVNVKFKIL